MKRITKIILLIICINCVLVLFAMPKYKKYVLVDYQERIMINTVEKAIWCFEEYEKTEEEFYLGELRDELVILSRMYTELEDIAEYETSFYMELSWTCSILERQPSSLKKLEYIKKGLNMLKLNLYCETPMFLEFYNINTH